MTLKQLADKIGVTEVSASRYEKEDQRLTLPLLHKIAAALDCGPADLLVLESGLPETPVKGGEASPAPFAERIASARKAAGLSQEALASSCGISRAAVAQWENGETKPKHTNLAPVAAKLGVSVAWLLGEGDGEGGEKPALPPPNVDLAGARELPALATMSRDLPVIGTAVGGNGGDFQLNGTTVDYARRPPALANIKTAFAIYLRGDSMEPRYEDGDLLYVHPGRPATPGRDVLIELHGDNGEPGSCFVKRLVRRTATALVLRQYNPDSEFEIPLDQVRVVYPILKQSELMGV